MATKPICQVTHGQISNGTCPWCNTHLPGGGEDQQTAVGRTGTCNWNLAAVHAALDHQDAEIRTTTISNLMSEHGPALEIAIPLLAKALEDATLDVRSLAENALSRLGRDLSDTDAEEFEAQVQGSPHELATRISLLAYYFLGQQASLEAREARNQHVFWVIRNAPELDTAGAPDALILELQDTEGYEKAKLLWLEQVARHPSNARLLGNAARFLMLNDKDTSEAPFKKAKEVEPANPDWSSQLGHLYVLQSRGTGTSAGKYARLAFQELRASETVRQQSTREASDAISRNTSEDDAVENLLAKIHSLPDLAKAAFAAGEFSDAARFASELLALAASEDLPEFFREDGNAIHYGNLVLGQCEMRKRNIKQAKEHLLASGRTEGSPNLCSFGPNMSLAKELLEIGEQDVVLEYFDLCKSFWKSHTDELRQWSGEVRQGEMPYFGANLNY